MSLGDRFSQGGEQHERLSQVGKKRRQKKSVAGRNKRHKSGSFGNSTARTQASLPPELHARVASDPHDLAAALDLADHCARHGFESRISEILSRHEKDYPFDDAHQSERYDRLLAFGYGYTNDFTRAEGIIERALSAHGPSRDIFFVQAYVKLSMREYDQTLGACIRYLELRERVSDIAAGPAYASQVNNFLGVAYGQVSQPDKAAQAFQQAITCDSSNHLPYLNLAGLWRSRNQLDQAAEVVKQGLKRCRQVHELRMLLETLKQRADISACLMVKNEEELLPGCLDSIRDWVTEIIVVDTGSTDRTVEIAREYGARVFHQTWEDDFSRHRNYSIEQATGDWIFIIDADERIFTEDVSLIQGAVNADNYAILSLNIYNVYGENEDRVTYSNSVRFFKRSLELRYEGIVHNDLVLPKDEPILRTRIRLKHLGYDLSPERMKQKFARTIALLEKQLEADPDNAFTLFNYAELLRGVDPIIKPENARKIVRASSRVVELTQPDDPVKRHLHLMCLNHLAAVYLSLKEYDQALQYCRRALEMRPDYHDAIMYSGFIYFGMKDYQRTIEQFTLYLEMQAGFDGSTEEAPVILTHPNSRDLAYTNLGIVYELTGDRRRAGECYEEALKVNPGYGETASFRGLLHLSEGNDLKAAELFQHQLDHGRDTVKALLGLAAINVRRNRPMEAEQYFRRAVEAFPENRQVRVELGKFFLESGRDDEAAETFDKGVELDAGADRCEAEVAEICFEKRRFEMAADYYTRAIDKYEPSSELLNDLGNCYFKLERYPEAEEHYLRAAGLTPATPLAYRNLGLTQAHINKPREAAEALERYLEVSSDEPEIRRLIADQYRAVGEHDSAIKHYEQILISEPQNVVALLGLSESYFLMGHRDAALLGFRRLLEIDPDCQPARDRISQLTESVRQT